MRNTLLAIIAIIFFISNSCSKKDSSSPSNSTTVPSIYIGNIIEPRDTIANSSSNYTFTITLSAATNQPVKIDYSTADSTAFAGRDYTAVSGTLQIPAGSTTGTINVPVNGSNVRAAFQVFKMVLSNPVNASFTNSNYATAIIENYGTNFGTDTTGYTTPMSYPGFTLTWSDEFSESAIDSTVWGYDLGNGGWGNNELECYTNSSNNSFISNGNLVIQARNETVVYNGATSNYTSARMKTLGKYSFQYGRMDIRAKLPVGKGLWPALWMLGNNFPTVGWPNCGETDVMELIGNSPNQVSGSVHWLLGGGGSGTITNTYDLTVGNDFSQKYHVFSLVWTQNQIQIYVDDYLYMSANNLSLTSGSWPFNQPQFLIFNVAVGGNWPGPPSPSTIFPESMYVDYVRVFQ